MKRILLFVAFFFSPVAASAEEFALGGGVAAGAAQVQGDFEMERRVGFQLGVGELLDHDSLAISFGGRFYFMRETVTPYVGGLFSHWEGHRHHSGFFGEEHGDVQHIGPTIGVRFRDRGEGLGAFVELELLGHLNDEDDDHFHPALGAGIQWWF